MRDTSPRMLKVNSTLREVLAEEMERMNDDRLEMVSITAVETSPNLRSAVVYVDVLGADDQEAALVALRKASRRLQSAIGRQVRIKYTPTLEFEIDQGVVGGDRIETILKGLHEEEGIGE
ncbi:MAG TPA: 30S ribosome-binding factor RbfA [Acidimicrobiia bacterium]|nr:30S ribosome-binding factor RbfA [Acidimicrobiia bacterium]